MSLEKKPDNYRSSYMLLIQGKGFSNKISEMANNLEFQDFKHILIDLKDIILSEL